MSRSHYRLLLSEMLRYGQLKVTTVIKVGPQESICSRRIRYFYREMRSLLELHPKPADSVPSKYVGSGRRAITWRSAPPFILPYLPF
jgi:hypothetical protein